MNFLFSSSLKLMWSWVNQLESGNRWLVGNLIKLWLFWGTMWIESPNMREGKNFCERHEKNLTSSWIFLSILRFFSHNEKQFLRTTEKIDIQGYSHHNICHDVFIGGSHLSCSRGKDYSTTWPWTTLLMIARKWKEAAEKVCFDASATF